ncbi:MAG: DedA family protein [Acidobacteria bacterium]|nr:MAG: DedA family protein [Acidobacteriota bacterium]
MAAAAIRRRRFRTDDIEPRTCALRNGVRASLRLCHAGPDVERELVAWLVRFGAPLLFFAQVFGIFGVPIPDELLLTIAGALVATGRLNLSSTVVAAIAGCLTGITLSYAVGRWVGLPLLRVRFRGRQDVIERAQGWFRRFGGWLLTFGYFIPGVRHVTAIAAGSACLNYPQFAAFAYCGGVLWCAVFLGLGYFAGDHWPEVAHAARSHVARGAMIIVAIGAMYVIAKVAAERSRSRS